MLVSLTVSSLALFSRATLSLEGGFVTLTGETGAGKSLVVDALSFVTGKRMGREIIRTGEEKCEVRALFSPVSEEKREALALLGIECETDGIELFRSISRDGRGVCRINGVMSTLTQLRQVAELFCDIHEQEQSSCLLDESRHVGFLDAYGGAELSGLLHEYREAYRTYSALRAEFAALRGDPEEERRRKEFLTYQISELSAAKLRVGEYEELTQKKERLTQSKRITDALGLARASLLSEGGAYDSLMRASTALSEVEDALPEYREIAAKLETLGYEAQSLGTGLEAEAEYADADAQLERIQARLSELSRLFRLYGEDEEALCRQLADKQAQLAALSSAKERARELHARAKAARDAAHAVACRLSQARCEQAARLEAQITERLSDLDMPRARFTVRVSQQEKLSETGLDSVAFYLAANVGQDAAPLAKVASGGELSRVLLALRCVLAGADDTDVLVFDEIDTGVSGKSAVKIGRAMRTLSRDRQVLAVTHSAQVAAFAHHHIRVQKEEADGTTQARLFVLDARGRQEELARILGGETVTDVSLAGAAQLLREGQQ